MKKLIFSTVITLLAFNVTVAQRYDTLVQVDDHRTIPMQVYNVGDTTFIYPKPRPAAFIRQIPATFAGAARISFKRESVKNWAIVAGSTAVLLLLDEEIRDKVQQASRHIGLDATRVYHNGLSFTVAGVELDVYDPPGNLNTAIYSIGEGVPPLLLGAGLFTFGLIKKDYRSISTASQIVQATTACGFMTQFIKRTTGRESPHRSTQPGGKWRPFPKPSVYQNNVPMYDAFSSGHMGTMVATYVVVTENYPEKRWIRPVGIALMSLVGLSMINNDVHWASDYPLAVGMGYAFGKATVKLNRFIRGEPLRMKGSRAMH